MLGQYKHPHKHPSQLRGYFYRANWVPEMDLKVIWLPILSTSWLGQSQLRSVELSSLERQGADLAFVRIKAGLSFFFFFSPAGKHNSVSNKGKAVNLGLSKLSTFPFLCVVSDLTARTEGVGKLSAFSLGNKELFCFACVCTPLDVCSMQNACVRFLCVCVCARAAVSTRICVLSFLFCAWVCKVYMCRLFHLLLLVLYTIDLNFGLLASLLLLPSEKSIKNPTIHAERIRILYFFYFFFGLFFPLPSESVAKQLLSGSARELGIWYQAPSYFCEQSPQSNFHGV